MLEAIFNLAIRKNNNNNHHWTDQMLASKYTAFVSRVSSDVNALLTWSKCATEPRQSFFKVIAFGNAELFGATHQAIRADCFFINRPGPRAIYASS